VGGGGGTGRETGGETIVVAVVGGVHDRIRGSDYSSVELVGAGFGLMRWSQEWWHLLGRGGR
jgi:hypothetical protein